MTGPDNPRPRPTPADLAGLRRRVEPEQAVEGIRLGDIDRPFREQLTLGRYNGHVLIDNSIVLSYTVDPTASKYSGLFVARSRSIPLVPDTGPDVTMREYTDEERAALEAQFGGIYVGIREKRPAFYIGTGYKVSLLDKSSKRIGFSVASVRPISWSEVDQGEDPVQLLERIHR